MPRPNYRDAALLLPALFITPPATAIGASMPLFRDAFAAVPDADFWVRLILATPALFIVLSALAVGALSDRIGRVPLLTWAALVYGIAGAAPLLLDSLTAMFFTRALQGIATGALLVASTGLIGDLYDEAGRARMLASQGALLVAGSILSTVIGGGLAEFGWRMPHALFLAALALIPLFRAAFRGAPIRAATEPPGPSGPQASQGARWAIAGLFALNILCGIAYFMVPSQVPFRMVELGLERPGLIGLASGLLALISVAAAMAFPRLRARFSPPAIAALTFASIAAGYAGLALAPALAWGLGGLGVAMIGMGLFAPTLQDWLLSRAPGAARGKMLGGLAMAMFLGMFASPLISQPIVAAFGTASAFGAAAAALAGLALLLAAIARQSSRTPATPNMKVSAG